MPKTIDLTGCRFGRLLVLRRNQSKPRSNGGCNWICECECGALVTVSIGDLNSGTTRSCGCLWRDTIRIANSTHGLSKHPLYSVWSGIVKRCTNPNQQAYANYGGRGVSVCDEWRNHSEKFIQWALANGWKKGLEIDRIDNDGNYEPNNCRCVTRTVNANNCRKNRIIVYEGKEYTAANFHKEFGRVPYKRFWARLVQLGWPPDIAAGLPIQDKIMEVLK